METVMKCWRFENQSFPVVRKCCYCVPLRRGVIIYGYVSLMFTLLSFPILLFMLVEARTNGHVSTSSVTTEPYVHLPLSITLGVVDLILTVILLMGAHKKRKELLKIYFYAGSVWTLLTVLIDLVYLNLDDYVQNVSYVFVVIFNVYLLFLVYNTVYVIEERAAMRYVTYRDQQFRL